MPKLSEPRANGVEGLGTAPLPCLTNYIVAAARTGNLGRPVPRSRLRRPTPEHRRRQSRQR